MMPTRHFCQDLAGSWYARRERVSCECKGSVGSMDQWRRGGREAQTRQKLRGSNGLQEVDEDKTKV